MKLTAAITKDEMETDIILDGSGFALIDTTVPKMIRKCQKLGYELVREDTYEDKVVGACFRAPSKCVSLRAPAKPISEERKKVLSDRMKAIHSKGGDK